MFDFLLSHTVRRVQNANHMENSYYNMYVEVLLLNHLEQNILKTLRKKILKASMLLHFKYTNSMCIIAGNFCKFIEMLKGMRACRSYLFNL